MTERWERHLARWQAAALIDAATAARIRDFEAARRHAEGLRWPVLIAVSLGALLVGAGVLLFVAAHWSELSPAIRFALVLALVATFHVAGALATERFPVFATAMHAVGTVALGAGIFLAGQIFNLQAHWPGGVMLWAIGAGVAWVLLRDAPQAALAALLVPGWLASEWIEATGGLLGGAHRLILPEALLLLSIVYLTASGPERVAAQRGVLAWIGGIALLPLAAQLPFAHTVWGRDVHDLPSWLGALGWALAFGLPLALAVLLRRKAAWMHVIAALWVLALGSTALPGRQASGLLAVWQAWGPYVLWLAGAIGLIAWGLNESRRARINLGVAAFAITVLAFYFSTVMNMLGRATSLLGLGLLFVAGGWLLERTRRRLVGRLNREDTTS